MTAPRRRRPVWSIYRNLFWAGAVIAVGLAAALLGDVWWDYISWALLVIPIVLFGYFVIRRTRTT
jgi:membrane protein implicated in regulation of membrane protease activity